MVYKVVWLKGNVVLSALSCEFDNFDDAKDAAVERLANYRELFGAMVAKVEDSSGNQVFVYGGGH